MTHKFMLAFALALRSSSAPALAQDTPAGIRLAMDAVPGVLDDCAGTTGPAARARSRPARWSASRPSGRFGVAITTTVDGKNVLEQTIVADGSAQPLSQADCSGTQTSDWSRDGERLFTRVSLNCTGRPARDGLGHHDDGERTMGRRAGHRGRRRSRPARAALSPHERSVCRRAGRHDRAVQRRRRHRSQRESAGAGGRSGASRESAGDSR